MTSTGTVILYENDGYGGKEQVRSKETNATNIFQNNLLWPCESYEVKGSVEIWYVSWRACCAWNQCHFAWITDVPKTFSVLRRSCSVDRAGSPIFHKKHLNTLPCSWKFQHHAMRNSPKWGCIADVSLGKKSFIILGFITWGMDITINFISRVLYLLYYAWWVGIYLTLSALRLSVVIGKICMIFKSFQELPEDSPDLADLANFPNGVKSIILKENSKKWQVFTQAGFHGAKVILEPGRRYASLDAMGLGNAVKSMRRLIVEKVTFV